MIDLAAAQRTVAGIDLAADSDDPFLFHALPPRLAVVREADGTPRLHLFRLVRDGELSEAIFDVVVEAAHRPAALEEARSALTDLLRDTEGRVRIAPVGAVGGEARLLYVGADSDGTGAVSAPLFKSHGSVVPLLDPPYTARFSVRLAAAAARVFDDALRAGAAPLGVELLLQIEVLRPAIRVVAHVDYRRVYEQLSSEVKEGYLLFGNDVQKITERLVETKAVQIRAVEALATAPSNGEPTVDIGPALAFVEREILERCCQPILPLDRTQARASLGTTGEVLDVGVAFAIKPREQVELLEAEIDLQVRAATRRTVAVQAHLAELLAGAPPDQCIEDLQPTSPFFERAALHLTTAQPLSAAFVGEVIAHFQYGRADLPIRLSADAPEGSADTWADQAPDRTWRLPLEVAFTADSPFGSSERVTLPALTGQSRELCLDLFALLGLRAIEVIGSPDPRVVSTRIELEHRRKDARVGPIAACTIGAETPRGTLYARDVQQGDALLATVLYLLRDGKLLKLAPFAVDTTVLRLPPPFPGSITVELVAAEDWTDLQRVVVTLQKSADLAAGTVVLTGPGDSAAVALDLPDPSDRRYRYRMSRTLADGTLDEDDWMETDRAMLLVGRTAADVLVVDVKPVGIELPVAGVNAIEVDLQYIDAVHQLRSTPTAVLRALADTYHWVIKLADPSLRTYQFRITVHRNDGTTQVGAWTASVDRLLLVPVARVA